MLDELVGAARALGSDAEVWQLMTSFRYPSGVIIMGGLETVMSSSASTVEENVKGTT